MGSASCQCAPERHIIRMQHRMNGEKRRNGSAEAVPPPFPKSSAGGLFPAGQIFYTHFRGIFPENGQKSPGIEGKQQKKKEI